VGCGEQKNKNDLIRIVHDSQDNVYLDPTGKSNGRGAYICRNISCLDKAYKTHALNRSFKTELSEEIYKDLRKELSLVEE